MLVSVIYPSYYQQKKNSNNILRISTDHLTTTEVMCSIPVYASMLSSSQCPSGGRVAVDTLCQFECESGEVTQPAIISCTSSGHLEAGVPQCRGNSLEWIFVI